MSLAIVLGCSSGCGTIVDLTSDSGPHVYGGVSHSATNVSRHTANGSPFLATYSILDIPISAVFDTVLLPYTLVAESSKPDPEVENPRRINQACADLAKQLTEKLQRSVGQLAVVDFTTTGLSGGAFAKDLSEKIRSALAETDKVAGVLTAERVNQATRESGLTVIEDALVVRSLCQQLGAGALVTGTYERSPMKVKLHAVIRSGTDGMEIARAEVEAILLYAGN